jgi:hypothetical protein
MTVEYLARQPESKPRLPLVADLMPFVAPRGCRSARR